MTDFDDEFEFLHEIKASPDREDTIQILVIVTSADPDDFDFLTMTVDGIQWDFDLTESEFDAIHDHFLEIRNGTD